jgi:hypothetical protein
MRARRKWIVLGVITTVALAVGFAAPWKAWKSGRKRRIPTFPQRRRLFYRHNFQTTPSWGAFFLENETQGMSGHGSHRRDHGAVSH